jgi:hypothetical protein
MGREQSGQGEREVSTEKLRNGSPPEPAYAVPDMEPTDVGNIGNYYGGIRIKAEAGVAYWCIGNYDGDDWEECPPPVFAALAATLQAVAPQQPGAGSGQNGVEG